MKAKRIHTVTGAFGNSGAYLAEKLLAKGLKVETLTNSPDRPSPLKGRIGVHPLCFDDVPALAKSLKNTAVLYNNYWVRYNADRFNYDMAVENSRRLFAAAKKAKVGRVLQVSITNPDKASPYEYFRGKGLLEEALIATGLPYSILRPPLLFGPEDILINNIAWMLRKFPVFGLFGLGNYRVQPIFAPDLAALAMKEGQAKGKRLLNALGPETFTFRQMVEMLRDAMGLKTLILPMPASLGWLAGQVMGAFLRDDLITWEEIIAFMADTLYVHGEPLGKTKLSVWAKENAGVLGSHYVNELERRRNRSLGYGLAARH